MEDLEEAQLDETSRAKALAYVAGAKEDSRIRRNFTNSSLMKKAYANFTANTYANDPFYRNARGAAETIAKNRAEADEHQANADKMAPKLAKRKEGIARAMAIIAKTRPSRSEQHKERKAKRAAQDQADAAWESEEAKRKSVEESTMQIDETTSKDYNEDSKARSAALDRSARKKLGDDDSEGYQKDTASARAIRLRTMRTNRKLARNESTMALVDAILDGGSEAINEAFAVALSETIEPRLDEMKMVVVSGMFSETTKKTAARYIQNAAQNISSHAFSAGHAEYGAELEGTQDDGEHNKYESDKVTKRQEGIHRAIKILSKEETELDEGATGMYSSDGEHPKIAALKKKGFKRVASGNNGWTHHYEHENGSTATVEYGPGPGTVKSVRVVREDVEGLDEAAKEHPHITAAKDWAHHASMAAYDDEVLDGIEHVKRLAKTKPARQDIEDAKHYGRFQHDSDKDEQSNADMEDVHHHINRLAALHTRKIKEDVEDLDEAAKKLGPASKSGSEALKKRAMLAIQAAHKKVTDARSASLKKSKFKY